MNSTPRGRLEIEKDDSNKRKLKEKTVSVIYKWTLYGRDEPRCNSYIDVTTYQVLKKWWSFWWITNKSQPVNIWSCSNSCQWRKVCEVIELAVILRTEQWVAVSILSGQWKPSSALEPHIAWQAGWSLSPGLCLPAACGYYRYTLYCWSYFDAKYPSEELGHLPWIYL